jgi:hypothetical protein
MNQCALAAVYSINHSAELAITVGFAPIVHSLYLKFQYPIDPLVNWVVPIRGLGQILVIYAVKNDWRRLW